MENSDSFVVIVSSNKQLDIFPYNSPAEFTNQLSLNYDLSEYEVALKKIFYHDRYLGDNPKFLETVKEKTDKPFFPENQNVIWFNQIVDTKIKIIKKSDTLDEFIKDTNEQLAQALVPAVLKFEYDDDKIIVRSILDYSEDPGYRISLGNVGKMLGFQEEELGSNDVHYFITQPNLDEFNTLPLNHEMTITKHRWKLSKVELTQLQNLSCDDIAVELARASLESGFRLAALVDEEEQTLTINTYNPEVIVTLSPFLNEYFRFGWRKSFSGLETIKIPPEVMNPFETSTESYKSPDNLKSAIIPSKLLVCCGLTFSNYLGPSPISVLDIFERQEGAHEFVREVTNPIYYPISKFESNQITIKLLDENLGFLPDTGNASSVVLHFRRKWLG